MPYDGNGNFIRVHNWTADAANGLDINASEMDAEDNGFATGLSNAVTRDGQGKMTVDFLPNADNTLNLGNGSFRWASINGVQIPSGTNPFTFYPRTAAEISASVTPTTFSYAPGIFERYGAVGNGSTNDNTAIANALLQSAQTGGSPAKALARKTYSIGANTLVIPDNGVLDISSAALVSTNATVITFGSNTTLFGYYGATITSSGAAGTALKKTSTATPAAIKILGWPYISPTVMGTAGSIGLDFTASYKGIFEVNFEGYETNIIGGAGTDTPQTYYNEFRSLRMRCTSGLTGMKLQRGCISTTIINPQINGGLSATKGIWGTGASSVGASGVTILGGYIEGFQDIAATRGIQIDDGFNWDINGTTFDSGATSGNFALGVTGASTQINFYGCGFGTGWASSTNILSWTASGVYNFVGGAPTNQVCLIGLSTFAGGYANGEMHMGNTISIGTMSFIASVAANYLGRVRNTGDGQGLLIENNSATTTAGRSALSINRAGGAGYVLDFQNNGAAAGGIAFGAGNPNGVVTGVKGTLYVNTNGGAGTTLYVNEAGGTVWVGK